MLPLEARAGLPEPTRAGAERALRGAVRRAGRAAVPVSQPPCPEPPCPEARPPLGDEPDALLGALAASSGAPAVLAGWAAPLPDGSFAWALRLVEAPPSEAPAAGADGVAAPEASATPEGATPEGATPGDGGRARAAPGRSAFRTVDRAGGQARDAEALARDLARAAARLLAGPPAPSPRGQRTVGDLVRRLGARSGLFDACFAERLLATPNLAGVALVRIAVGPRGEVRDAQVASSFADPVLEACLADAAAQIDFPSGVGGTSVLDRRLGWPRPTER